MPSLLADLTRMRRPAFDESLLITVTIGLIVLAAYSAWTGAARFLLVESTRKPAVFTAVGVLCLLPPVALLVGQLMLRRPGSVALCVTAMVVAGLGVLGYADAPASHDHNLVVALLGAHPRLASIDMSGAAVVAGVQLVVALSGLGVAWAMRQGRNSGAG